jgi:hypothetical protein
MNQPQRHPSSFVGYTPAVLLVLYVLIRLVIG